jgi:hypothetical protein
MPDADREAETQASGGVISREPDGFTAPTYHPPHIDNWGSFRRMTSYNHVGYPRLMALAPEKPSRLVMTWAQAAENANRVMREADEARAAEREAESDQSPARPDFSLLPPRALRAIASMMTVMTATGKHGRDDWRDQSVSYHINAATNHLNLLACGDESEDHLKHAACRLLMALDQREAGTE